MNLYTIRMKDISSEFFIEAIPPFVVEDTTSDNVIVFYKQQSKLLVKQMTYLNFKRSELNFTGGQETGVFADRILEVSTKSNLVTVKDFANVYNVNGVDLHTFKAELVEVKMLYADKDKNLYGVPAEATV